MAIKYWLLIIIILGLGAYIISGIIKSEQIRKQLEGITGSSQEQVSASTQPSAKPANINFQKDGNLVQDQNGQWNFLYEEPGSPALRVNLNFNWASQCDFEKGGRCDPNLFQVGDRVHVEGERQAETLTVVGMTKL